jgi:hypothetical protein
MHRGAHGQVVGTQLVVEGEARVGLAAQPPGCRLRSQRRGGSGSSPAPASAGPALADAQRLGHVQRGLVVHVLVQQGQAEEVQPVVVSSACASRPGVCASCWARSARGRRASGSGRLQRWRAARGWSCRARRRRPRRGLAWGVGSAPAPGGAGVARPATSPGTSRCGPVPTAAGSALRAVGAPAGRAGPFDRPRKGGQRVGAGWPAAPRPARRRRRLVAVEGSAQARRWFQALGLRGASQSLVIVTPALAGQQRQLADRPALGGMLSASLPRALGPTGTAGQPADDQPDDRPARAPFGASIAAWRAGAPAAPAAAGADRHRPVPRHRPTPAPSARWMLADRWWC